MVTLLKQYIQIACLFSPRFIRREIAKFKSKWEFNQAMQRMKRTKVSKEEIVAALDRLNINSDVMFHISMMNIGKLSGGTKFLAEQIEKHVDTTKHTLLLSALPYRGRFKDYLQTNPVFDVRTAPVAMGAVNEYFALKSETLRSIHPTHSVIALGPRAEEYTCEHHLDETPFGIHSPYYKLLVNDGKIVLFGATWHNLTMFHVFEDLLGTAFPVKHIYTSPYRVKVIDKQGQEFYVSTPCHQPIKAIMRNSERKVVRDKLLGSGAIQQYKIGEGLVSLIHVRQFAKAYFDLLLQGQSIYGAHKVTPLLKEKISTIINQFN